MARIYPDTKPTSEGQTITYQGAAFRAKLISPKSGAKSYLRWVRTDTNMGTFAGAKRTTRRVNCLSEKGRTRAGMKRVPALSPYCAELGKEYAGSESPPRMYVVKANAEKNTRSWVLASGQRKQSSGRSGRRSERKAPREPAKNYPVGTAVGDHVVGTYTKKNNETGKRWYTRTAFEKRKARGVDAAYIVRGDDAASPAELTAAAAPAAPRASGGRGGGGKSPGPASNYEMGQVVDGTKGSRWKVVAKKGGGKAWKRLKNTA